MTRPTFLRVGVERSTTLPPLIIGDCTTPRITGEVLHDPGFENQLSTFGTGPNLADDIPHNVNTSTDWLFRWPETDDALFNNDPALGDATYWAQDYTNTVSGNDRWLIKTANPQAGTSHARMTSTTAKPASNNLLYAVRQARCDKPSSGTWGSEKDWYSARTDPGDVVTFSIYAMVDTTSDTPALDLVIAGINIGETGWGNTFVEQQFSLTTSYVKYQVQAVTDSSEDAVMVWAGPRRNSGGTTIFDFDTASLTVS